MDDRQRFSEVVLPYLDDALSLARWLTGNVADAEDVVQDVGEVFLPHSQVPLEMPPVAQRVGVDRPPHLF